MHRSIDHGWIEVITSGAMYAGKTTELIRRVRTHVLARRAAVIFQPNLARRYTGAEEVVTHDGVRHTAHYVGNPLEVFWYAELNHPNVIAIDEAQFFDDALVEVVQQLADRDHHLIVAGLSTTSEGSPFGCMPGILAAADQITTLFGVCVGCGEPATRSFALRPKSTDIDVGAVDKYEARCRRCWLEGRRMRGEA